MYMVDGGWWMAKVSSVTSMPWTIIARAKEKVTKLEKAIEGFSTSNADSDDAASTTPQISYL